MFQYPLSDQSGVQRQAKQIIVPSQVGFSILSRISLGCNFICHYPSRRHSGVSVSSLGSVWGATAVTSLLSTVYRPLFQYPLSDQSGVQPRYLTR